MTAQDDIPAAELGDIARSATTGGGGQHAQKLARSVFTGRIASALRKAIISGELPAGAPLAEARLAEQLAVSRGPVRSALHALEGEGLVRTRPNGRMVVAGFDRDDLRDLFDVRLLLESSAVRWAGSVGYDDAAVVACFEAMRAEGSSTPQLVDLDVDFHRALVALSGSRFLQQSWSALAPVVHAAISLGNAVLAERDPVGNFERIIRSHEGIVAALVARDVEGVVAALADQFELTRSTLPLAAPGTDTA